MLHGNSKEHFSYFINKIQKGEHFGVIRPADGEFQVLCNNTLTNCDNWTFKSGGVLSQHLYSSVCTPMNNLYVGIPCDTCCNKEMCDTYKKILGDNKNITYANIFCNANWKDFIQFLKGYEKGFYLITSGTSDCQELPIKDRFIIDPYQVNRWDTEWQTITQQILEYVKDKKNELICFSAGPLSKIWIPLCMRFFPENIYLDVGSTLDTFVKGSSNRFYIYDTDNLSKQVCNFN